MERILLIGAHDGHGGAARATFRLFRSLVDCPDVDANVFLRVVTSTTGSRGVLAGKPRRTSFQNARYWLITRLRKILPRPISKTVNPIYSSVAEHPSGLAREINGGRWDVVVLNWLGNSTLSIEEIKRMRHPVVWHIHDMWLFGGADHYSLDNRHRVGFSRSSRDPRETGPDINRKTYLRKLRSWRRKNFHVVAPSKWLANEVQKSTLGQDWVTHVLPYPLDADHWIPEEKAWARQVWGISETRPVVLFGAVGGTGSWFKGGDLLFEALRGLDQLLEGAPKSNSPVLVVFGKKANIPSDLPFESLAVGELDDAQLRQVYSAADVLVVPSRQEAFGQVATEAMACGTPVVAFRVGGLPEIVQDYMTGRLVDPYDTKQLAEAIHWFISDLTRARKLGETAREWVVDNLSPEKIGRQYLEILRQAREDLTAPRRGNTEGFLRRVAKASPLGRLGRLKADSAARGTQNS